MTNPYQAILEYRGDFWEGYLKELCLYDTFADLFVVYTDHVILGKVLRYIVLLYSEESDKVILNMSLLENKQNVFRLVQLPEDLFDDIVFMKNNFIVKAIIRWLEFQDRDVFMQLIILKELWLEMLQSANSPLKKVSGEIDFDQKFKNANYAKDLRKMISDLENELIQNSPILVQFVKEVKEVAKKRAVIGVEEFIKRH